jgi:DNA invertase Pin-like site-specific DNA recombinase
MEGEFVTYYRVSTQRQGKSGLGLEAQKKAIEDYLNGGNHQVIEEFVEVESGKGSNALDRRPILKEAIQYAKKHKAKLLIAKLDRLARNVHFISSLMESKVDFVIADMPEANALTIHLLSAVAEYERELISKRTKEALAAAKRRGTKLGNPNLKADNRKRKKQAQDFAKKLKPTLKAYRVQGMSQRAIVDELNSVGITAPRGGEWRLVQVQRVMTRLGI